MPQENASQPTPASAPASTEAAVNAAVVDMMGSDTASQMVSGQSQPTQPAADGAIVAPTPAATAPAEGQSPDQGQQPAAAPATQAEQDAFFAYAKENGVDLAKMYNDPKAAFHDLVNTRAWAERNREVIQMAQYLNSNPEVIQSLIASRQQPAQPAQQPAQPEAPKKPFSPPPIDRTLFEAFFHTNAEGQVVPAENAPPQLVADWKARKKFYEQHDTRLRTDTYDYLKNDLTFVTRDELENYKQEIVNSLKNEYKNEFSERDRVAQAQKILTSRQQHLVVPGTDTPTPYGAAYARYVNFLESRGETDPVQVDQLAHLMASGEMAIQGKPAPGASMAPPVPAPATASTPQNRAAPVLNPNSAMLPGANAVDAMQANEAHAAEQMMAAIFG